MNKKTALSLGVVTTLALLTSVGYLVRRNKHRNRYQRLVKELLHRLQPSGIQLEAEAAFSPHYIQRVQQQATGRILMLKSSAAARLAKQLAESFRPWYYGGDDEQQIYQVLKQLQDKVQLAQVAQAFLKQTGTALISKFQTHLDAQELEQLQKILPKIPYREHV